jgi:arylsulfatase A-like enzyme/Flp pilus assembly protein TadD
MRRVRVARAVLLLLLALPGASSAQPPNVVLITLDTTRADRMGFMGSTRGLTPELDALARQGIVFDRAFSQAPITTVSHATILSGTFPPFHKVNDFGVPLPVDVPYGPDSFHQRRYRTAAFVASLVLDPRAGLAPGFDRGFDVYDAGFRTRRGTESRYATLERRGSDVVARAVAWIDENRGGPFFLWVHLFDAHDPYDPPEPFLRAHASQPYNGEIAYQDAAVGTLLSALRARGLFDNTAIAVLADHGESLGDHGEKTHGIFLYDSTLHVPLVLKMPGARYAGARVKARVRAADVMPTLLAIANVPVPKAMQGESLMSAIESDVTEDRTGYAETEYPRRAFGWSALSSLRSDRFLFIRAPKRELYDQVVDVGSRQNLAAQRSRVADGMAAELEALRRRLSGGEAGPSVRVDPAVSERLAALGYVGGSGTAPETGIDPKDRIDTANALHDAILAVEDGKNEQALPLLEKVTAVEPQIFMAQLQLGLARARQRDYTRAIPPLHKAIELQPDATMAHYEMGIALFETGDRKTAATHLEIVTARMPKWADARFSLAAVYARINRVPDAIAELRSALAIEPKHYRANLLLGRVLTLQGKAADAVPFLETAVTLQPDSNEALSFLAEAYEKAGRAADAQRTRSKIRKSP